VPRTDPATASTSSEGVAFPRESDDDAALRRVSAEKCTPSHQPTELDHIQLAYYDESPLAVVRIAPDDQLNLRLNPGKDAAVVAQLPFLSVGLRPTGQACRVDGALWLEVTASERSGWVNSRYARPAAAFRSVERVSEVEVTTLQARSLSELGRRLGGYVAADASVPGEVPDRDDGRTIGNTA
jgi:hypothetical protein